MIGFYVAALLVGSYLSFLIDCLKLYGTKIPCYGYLSTVIFTEKLGRFSLLLYYIFLLLMKGLVYLALFFLVQRCTSLQKSRVR